MKSFVLTILLIFSLTHILDAGLDTDAIFNHVIAIYHFETTEESDEGLLYTEDSGPQNLPGALLEGASLTEGGKSGKCLSLVGDDVFGAGTRLFPHFAAVGFSIVAWIKRPEQNNGLVFAMSGFYAADRQNIASEIDLGVTPTGNIKGTHITYDPDVSAILTTQDENISNDEWHHIAYTLFAGTYTLFIDGEPVLKHEATVFPGYYGDMVLFLITSPESTRETLIDEVGFFETGFSPYEIKGLYDDGLAQFLEMMPVSPQGRLATTWGEIKNRR